MCTALSVNGSTHYFGRNLDLEYDFGQQAVFTPRKYAFSYTDGTQSSNHYAMVGMANVTDGYPLYAEAVNEKGLGMAGLHFALCAVYPSSQKGAEHLVSPYEFIPWLLGQCATLDEAEALLSKTGLSDVPFSAQLPLSKLHWMVADASGSLIIEPLPDGLVVTKNPYNVLTNDPPFTFQTTNLNNYLNLTAKSPQSRFGPGTDLHALGKGAGALGLPGDSTPSSRFVRIAFNSSNSVAEGAEQELAQFFHLLDSVASIRGPVETEDGKYFITRYSSCMADGNYYYKTYENNQITCVSMAHEDLDGAQLACYPVDTPQQIRAAN